MNRVALACLAVVAACGPSPERQFETMCRERVDWTLRNPRDAEYGTSRLAPNGTSGHVSGHGGRMWFAYVDATNGFGATIRTDFVCVELEGEPIEVLTIDEFLERAEELQRQVLR